MKNLNYWFVKVSFRTSTLTASKNCKTRAYHCANYFSLIGLSESDYVHAMNGSDSPSECSSTVIYTWKLMFCIGRHFRKFSWKLCRELRSRSRGLLYLAWFFIERDVKIYARKVWVNDRHRYDHVLRARSYAADSGKYAQINNKYMLCVRMTHWNHHILCMWYHDVNNLYGCVNHTPNGSKTLRTLMRFALDSSTGYILEIDLEYLQHLRSTLTYLSAQHAINPPQVRK